MELILIVWETLIQVIKWFAIPTAIGLAIVFVKKLFK